LRDENHKPLPNAVEAIKNAVAALRAAPKHLTLAQSRALLELEHVLAQRALPEFHWLGDSLDQLSGTARWTTKDGYGVAVRFPTFQAAWDVSNAVTTAYQLGERAGMARLMAEIQPALDKWKGLHRL
jgi:hypothetical protein